MQSGTFPANDSHPKINGRNHRTTLPNQAATLKLPILEQLPAQPLTVRLTQTETFLKNHTSSPQLGWLRAPLFRISLFDWFPILETPDSSPRGNDNLWRLYHKRSPSRSRSSTLPPSKSTSLTRFLSRSSSTCLRSFSRISITSRTALIWISGSERSDV